MECMHNDVITWFVVASWRAATEQTGQSWRTQIIFTKKELQLKSDLQSSQETKILVWRLSGLNRGRMLS